MSACDPLSAILDAPLDASSTTRLWYTCAQIFERTPTLYQSECLPMLWRARESHPHHTRLLVRELEDLSRHAEIAPWAALELQIHAGGTRVINDLGRAMSDTYDSQHCPLCWRYLEPDRRRDTCLDLDLSITHHHSRSSAAMYYQRGLEDLVEDEALRQVVSLEILHNSLFDEVALELLARSPHLTSLRDLIVVDSAPLSLDALTKILERPAAFPCLRYLDLERMDVSEEVMQTRIATLRPELRAVRTRTPAGYTERLTA